MYKDKKKYTKVELTIDEVQLLRDKFIQEFDKIHVLEVEKWSDGCTVYECMYRGCRFEINNYKNGEMELGYYNLDEETEKLLNNLDFIFYENIEKLFNNLDFVIYH